MTAIGMRHFSTYDLLKVVMGMLRCAFPRVGRRAFGLVDAVQREGKSCRRVVVTKSIKQPMGTSASGHWPARHPAEMAALTREAQLHGRSGRLREMRDAEAPSSASRRPDDRTPAGSGHARSRRAEMRCSRQVNAATAMGNS